jgi:transcriptional regulator with XRE-family HTH domain
MEIGQKIARLRELKSLSQENLAQALNMSQSGYAKIERNEVSISIEKLGKISRILEVQISDVLNFDEKSVLDNRKTHPVLEKERQLYENQIKTLETENLYLKGIIDKLL